MNKSFLKHLIYDLFLWAIIVGGLVIEQPESYLYNVAIFILPAKGILGLLAGSAIHKTKDPTIIEKAATRTPLHRRYSWYSSAAETLVIAATGHFLIAITYAIGSMTALNGIDRLAKAAKQTKETA